MTGTEITVPVIGNSDPHAMPIVEIVTGAEFYRAMEQDIHPVMVFVLRDYAEYEGEKVCYYEGTRYRIVRTYITPQNTIELTVEEATVDA